MCLSLSLFIYVILQPYLERKLGCRVLSNEERCSVHIYIYVCFHNRQPAENKVNGIRVFVLCVCVYMLCLCGLFVTHKTNEKDFIFNCV